MVRTRSSPGRQPACGETRWSALAAGPGLLLAQPLACGQRELQVELLELLLVDRARRAQHQLLGLLVERKGGDLAQVRLIRDQHHDAVDAGRDPAMRRRAEVERAEHAAEALLQHVAARSPRARTP